MLTVYRRHTKDCPHTERNWKRCQCPLWVEGYLGSKYIRESLNLTQWEKAQEIVRDWEIRGSAEPVAAEEEPVWIKDAVRKFLEDAKARYLRDATISKYRVVLEKQLLPFAERKGLRYITELNVDTVREFRATWTDKPISAHKKLERLRAFFNFCVASEWTSKNPARGLRPPKITPNPTLSFSNEEMEKILWTCDLYLPQYPHAGEYYVNRLKALVLVLRYTRLRIRDAVCLEQKAVKDGRVFLHTQKTGVPVRVPVPPIVTEALSSFEPENDTYFFWSGVGNPKSAVGDWQRTFRKLFKLAGVKGRTCSATLPP